jgi:hypothetical protein
MGQNAIIIKGAREHNLKNVSLTIPRDKLVVITGLSGSGKSSLAFDTIYAEGQRRYVESLSSYARMFLGQMEQARPRQRSTACRRRSPSTRRPRARNPRSTVGTVTEIYDYLRLLFARVGIPHCPSAAASSRSQTTDQVADKIRGGSPPATPRARAWRRSCRGRKGEYTKLFEDLTPRGLRARARGRRDRAPAGRRADRAEQEAQARHPGRRGPRLGAPRRRGPHRRGRGELATNLAEGNVARLAAGEGRPRDALGRRRRAPRAAGPTSTFTRSPWRAPSTATPSATSSRATSRSTRRTAPAPTATAWACAASWTWTP